MTIVRTLDELIAAQTEEHKPFGTVYRYYIKEIEHDLVAKTRRQKRVARRIAKLTNEAQALVYFQLKELTYEHSLYDLTEPFKYIEWFSLDEISEDDMQKIKKHVIPEKEFRKNVNL